jgi:hypothetical protein
VTERIGDLAAYRAEIESWLAANLPLREPGAELRGTPTTVHPRTLPATAPCSTPSTRPGISVSRCPSSNGGQGLSRKHQQE